MTFSLELTDHQVSEIVCEELAKIIKREIDRKKEGKYHDSELVVTAMKLVRHYLTPSEYIMFTDVLDEYTLKND